MAAIAYRNPVWANLDHTSMNLEVQWQAHGPWTQYSTASFDPEPAGAVFFARVVEEAGADNIGEYVDITVPVAMQPVTRRQLRLTLVREGISLANIEALIAAMPDGLTKEEAQIEWADTQTFERNHPTLLLIAQALDLAPYKVDEMWLKAMLA